MHLKIISSFLMLFVGTVAFSQEATEIYLFDLVKSDSTFIIKNPKNISQNIGYDNQPSFTQDGTAILFSSSRNGQADIARYDIIDNYRNWITNTDANEYSPASYPNKKRYFTCVRLEQDGTQLLYKYSYKNKNSEILIPNLKVGYYVWCNSKVLVSYVLGEIETLQVSNFRYKIKYPIQENIGRSLNKVPSSISYGNELISFISKSHEVPEMYIINPQSSEIRYLADAIEGSEDFTWTLDGTLLMGKDDKIFKFKPEKDKNWSPITIESELPIQNITRLVVSPDGKKIAIVVKEILE